MSFSLPDDSLLPSTPNTRSLRSQPSTTPAGPPPSYLTNKSNTPAGIPPKGIFNSSYNPSNATFPRTRGSGLKQSTFPQSSPPRPHDDIQELDEAGMDVDLEESSLDIYARQSIATSTRGLKRSRNGKIRPSRESKIPAAVAGLVAQHKSTELSESDELIVQTEELISSLDGQLQELNPAQHENPLASTSNRLMSLWQRQYPPKVKEGGIGPRSSNRGAIAGYIASLLLTLHHPYDARKKSSDSQALVRRSHNRSKHTAIPKALLDWIDVHHNYLAHEYDTIHLAKPSPSSQEDFWDVVLRLIARGKLDKVIRLLKDAGWEHASSALDDGSEHPGYAGHQLQNAREVVDWCISVLELCPAVKDGDWNVTSADWSIFRQRVRNAIAELESYAQSETQDQQQENIFSRSMTASFSLSRQSRRAESKVPYAIYENLKSLYNILLGVDEDVTMTAQDWLEASIYQTIWWDGEDMARSRRDQTREVDLAPLIAYRRRLAESFEMVTVEPEDEIFDINTLDIAQVGIACIMEDDVTDVLELLQTLSLSIASAVADIAAYGGWLPSAQLNNSRLLQQGFDNDDLLVLSHGPESFSRAINDFNRDGLLMNYADKLALKPTLKAKDDVVREGWELAASVLGRIEDSIIASQKIAELLDRIEIDNDERADKVLDLCVELNLSTEAHRIAERYADNLVETTQQYGAILLYYARAHANNKLRTTLTSLTSMSLVQSMAFPPQSLVDDHLKSLLSSERHALVKLSSSDREAAQNLASQISGYATVRSFYDLRDNTSTKKRSLERKRASAKVLLAAIASASDCIRGGLLDPDVESVIAVDTLLALLGEILPLCTEKRSVFAQSQILALLRIIEDFHACPARIRNSAEEVLNTCFKAISEGDAGKLRQLRPSTSNMSSNSGLGGSSYDLLATSSMILQQASSTENTLSISRNWDWRTGLLALGTDGTNAESILLLLRAALGSELSKGWIHGQG